jgi:hypothetical protein
MSRPISKEEILQIMQQHAKNKNLNKEVKKKFGFYLESKSEGLSKEVVKYVQQFYNLDTRTKSAKQFN